MERRKALEHARNPGLSKYGHCIVSVNTRLNNLLAVNLQKLNAEFKRLELQAIQQKKQFVKTCGLLNHEPLLIVRRPPSAITTQTKESRGLSRKPGYMNPIKSKIARPSSLKTIDVFTAEPAKKKNLWELPNEESVLRFTSAVRPCAALSVKEYEELKIDYTSMKQSLSIDTSLEVDLVQKANRPASSVNRYPRTPTNIHEKDPDINSPELTVARIDKVSGNEPNDKESRVNTGNTAYLPLEYPKSSSFITEMEIQDKGKVLNSDNEQILIGETRTSVTKKNSNKSIKPQSFAKANDTSVPDDATRTDTRQIPYRLPTVGSQLPAVLRPNISTKTSKTEKFGFSQTDNSEKSIDHLLNQSNKQAQRPLSTTNASSRVSNPRLYNVQKRVTLRPKSFPVTFKTHQEKFSLKDSYIKQTIYKSVQFADNPKLE